MATTSAVKVNLSKQADFLPLLGTDYIEFYVGNAKQSAYYYKSAFGFQSVAYCGPETGVKDKASYVLRQNKLTLVFTTALRTCNPIAGHVYLHGDAVKILALGVEDAEGAWLETTRRGGKNFLKPAHLTDSFGFIHMAKLCIFLSREKTTKVLSCQVTRFGILIIIPLLQVCSM